MELLERSYAGEFFRPRPKVIITENPLKLLVLTSWGIQDESEAVVNLFQDQVLFEQNADMTTPQSRIDSLGPVANRLRSAAIYANDFLFREANKTEYVSAVELLGIVYQEGILSWVQIGAPHLLISTNGKIQPLAYQMDFAWQFDQGSPLVSQAMGLEASCQFSCGSLHVNSGSDLFFVSRGALPPQLFSEKDVDLKKLTQVLVNESPASPFWAGQLKLS